MLSSPLEGYLGRAAAVSCSARTSHHILAAQLMAIDIAQPYHYNDMDNSDSDNQDTDDNASLRSDRSDTSSEVTELDQADFPGYFQERLGRLFHSHGQAPYPLPVDTPEQQVRSMFQNCGRALNDLRRESTLSMFCFST